mmetsp:Transcript_10114/g.29789  ORF Transcript_10114/g.29789 Transcript_10114/m.29789 type:complete len:200 (+) Transcript_10114:103-702(+)
MSLLLRPSFCCNLPRMYLVRYERVATEKVWFGSFRTVSYRSGRTHACMHANKQADTKARHRWNAMPCRIFHHASENFGSPREWVDDGWIDSWVSERASSGTNQSIINPLSIRRPDGQPIPSHAIHSSRSCVDPCIHYDPCMHFNYPSINYRPRSRRRSIGCGTFLASTCPSPRIRRFRCHCHRHCDRHWQLHRKRRQSR